MENSGASFSQRLLTLDLAFDCPQCGHPMIKTGAWFQSVGRFTCAVCQAPIRLSYLFEKHGPS
jgi:transposase-like protein